ncbi:MAG: hypothetical protein ACXAEU_26265 [Candidatus Hodarchaeales archaeon]|jgi:hypothetical protein
MKSDLEIAFEEMAPYLVNIWKVKELLDGIKISDTSTSREELVEKLEELLGHQDVKKDMTLVTDLKIILNAIKGYQE